MFKRISLLSLTALSMIFTLSSCDVLQDVAETALSSGGAAALTEGQIGEGLKEALKQGVRKGVNTLSVKDGYFKNQTVKILFPAEAQKVEKTLRDIGAGSMVDDAIEKLNRAAEDAASGAKDIFVNAITSMTIQDATNILMGEKDACTQYLKRTTSDQLYQKFQPVIKNSLNKVGALNVWNTVITRYNRVPLVEKVNPNLDDHVTNKAMDGLFVMVEKEESNIRANPIARTTDLMKRVFAKQDK